MGLNLKWEKVAETQNQNESNWKPEAKKEKGNHMIIPGVPAFN